MSPCLVHSFEYYPPHLLLFLLLLFFSVSTPLLPICIFHRTIRDTPFSTPCRVRRIIDSLRFESYLLTLATGQRAHAPRRTIRRDIGIDVSLPRIEGRILASNDRISRYKFLLRFPSPCSNCRFIYSTIALRLCIYSFIYRGYRKTRDVKLDFSKEEDRGDFSSKLILIIESLRTMRWKF